MMHLVSWSRSSLYSSCLTPPKISPSPLFQRGVKFQEKLPPLKKGDRGGFEYKFGRSHRLNF
jgi:hypothetical protein